MTQTALAKRVGVSQASISRYLNGLNRPSPNVAKKLTKETGIKLEIWLFADKKELAGAAAALGLSTRSQQ